MKERLSAVEDLHHTPDVEETFSIAVAALNDSTVNRQLVHLIDVQKSVGADLGEGDCGDLRQKDWDGLEAEKDGTGGEQIERVMV